MSRLVAVLLLGLSWCSLGFAQEVEFNRDIRPILSDNCFACHGPDLNQRKANLRLDREEDVFAARDEGKLLVPGKPADSLIFQRISSTEAKLRMPPAKFGKQLSPKQVELVKLWIEQGAKWQGHWSRQVVKKPQLPKLAGASPSDNPIDRFIAARLEREKLSFSPEADRRTLYRRLSFDLTGLPPSGDALAAFLADKSDKAYEKAVDQLLASPHFGERLAQYWLDLVRYADTAGYHSDNHRDLYPYRDYVIESFNKNKPFDQFTREQLAGDLLPNPTNEQKIASGYNRLLQTTEEGGAQAKEYTAKYQADRVRNAASVWLGSTMGCAECHDHKFDPFTMRDFYRFAAFFADVKEKAVGRQDQTPLASPEQTAQLKQFETQLQSLQQKLAAPTKELDEGQAKWEEQAKKEGAKGLPKNIADLLAVDPKKRNDKQKQALAAHYRTLVPELEPLRKQIADVQKQKDALLKLVPTTLITESAPPRVVRMLPRGNWLDETGEIVQPGTPGSIAPTLAEKQRLSRLDLANWLVHQDNPLTSRVFVNRAWKLLFGEGLVKSLEDFGAQGTWPTHPELLDWLAVEFRESGWDVKKLLKLMLLSRTYRQSSLVSETLKQRDPYNELLARQSRYRLEAEMIRDNALAVSGLLVRKVGGPSAKPYQPTGYWALLNFPKREWQKDSGDGLYRRGLYTYWCRTFLHPSLQIFDAPCREECTVERPRSNTPLQALVLLNDPTYVEASRVFAEKLLAQEKPSTGTTAQQELVKLAFHEVLGRPASKEETDLLVALYSKHHEHYRANPAAAQALLSVGDKPAKKEGDTAKLAAWTSVARVILNLHETVTRD